jgi:hypothetical protein
MSKKDKEYQSEIYKPRTLGYRLFVDPKMEAAPGDWCSVSTIEEFSNFLIRFGMPQTISFAEGELKTQALEWIRTKMEGKPTTYEVH